MPAEHPGVAAMGDSARRSLNIASLLNPMNVREAGGVELRYVQPTPRPPFQSYRFVPYGRLASAMTMLPLAAQRAGLVAHVPIQPVYTGILCAAPGYAVPEPPGVAGVTGANPYARSPRLKLLHKMAERKRRSNLRQVFDELRCELCEDKDASMSKSCVVDATVSAIDSLVGRREKLLAERESLRMELKMQ